MAAPPERITMLKSALCVRLIGASQGFAAYCWVLLLALAAAGAAAQTSPPQIIEVKKGDTFSGIVIQLGGSASGWREMYRAELSRLPDPNVISVGMRFEVATDSKGAPYLRRITTPAQPPADAPNAPVAVVPAPAAAAPALREAPAESLVIGVLPYIGTGALQSQYEFLKAYLGRVAGEKDVRIVVPANFKAFFASTMKGEFDIAVSAPHFARVAQIDKAMTPLLIYEPRIKALFVAPADAAVVGAADVRGKAVAFANPQSLVAMYGQQWLRQQSLELGKDYEARGARTDMGVGRMLLAGDAVAAIMSNGELRSLPPEESERLKIVETFTTIPNFVVLAHPRLERDRVSRLKVSLKAFLADKDEGAAFARATNLTGMVDVDESMLRELDPYIALTRQAMAPAK
jgi:phosphonate transport system substrate-binding protein